MAFGSGICCCRNLQGMVMRYLVSIDTTNVKEKEMARVRTILTHLPRQISLLTWNIVLSPDKDLEILTDSELHSNPPEIKGNAMIELERALDIQVLRYVLPVLCNFILTHFVNYPMKNQDSKIGNWASRPSWKIQGYMVAALQCWARDPFRCMASLPLSSPPTCCWTHDVYSWQRHFGFALRVHQ